jgi:hypothetical protein
MRPRPWRILDIIETVFAILVTLWIASVAVWAARSPDEHRANASANASISTTAPSAASASLP